MGVLRSTLGFGYTPICEECGISLCWDIATIDYEDAQEFWDNWTCKCCNPDYLGALKRWKDEKRIDIFVIA